MPTPKKKVTKSKPLIARTNYTPKVRRTKRHPGDGNQMQKLDVVKVVRPGEYQPNKRLKTAAAKKPAATKKRKVTYSTAKKGNSIKKTVTSRGGKKTKVVNYTYTAPGKNSPGNQKTTTVTKKGKKGTSTKTKIKTQGRGKLKRLVQRKQRGRIVKKAIKAGTNKAKAKLDSYERQQ
jgi:hypothetical protein